MALNGKSLDNPSNTNCTMHERYLFNTKKGSFNNTILTYFHRPENLKQLIKLYYDSDDNAHLKMRFDLNTNMSTNIDMT